MINILYLLIIFIHPNSVNAEGFCPCQFHFNDAAEGDTTCYAQVPLVAGLKEIELDADLDHRESNFSFNMIMVYACKQAGAFVHTYVDTDYKEIAKNASGMFNYSLFFIKQLNNKYDNNATDTFECGFFVPISDNKTSLTGNIDKPPLVYGACAKLADKNRRIVSVLCEAAPHELSTQDEKNRIPDVEDLDPDAQYPTLAPNRREQCVCPCSFFYDKNYMCFRDVQRCFPTWETDDMIRTCASVGTVPAVVAWVNDIKDVPEQWPTENLFFVGEIPNKWKANDNDTDAQKCSYKAPNGKAVTPFPCDKAKDDIHYEFWSVLCLTYEIENFKQEKCADNDEHEVGEEERSIDEADCGAAALFGRAIQQMITIIAIRYLGLSIFE